MSAATALREPEVRRRKSTTTRRAKATSPVRRSKTVALPAIGPWITAVALFAMAHVLFGLVVSSAANGMAHEVSAAEAREAHARRVVEDLRIQVDALASMDRVESWARREGMVGIDGRSLQPVAESEDQEAESGQGT